MRPGILHCAVLGTLLFATICTAQNLRTCTTPFSAPHPLQRWPSTAALAPIPNATVHLFGAAQYPDTGPPQPCTFSFAHFCSDDLHASPLVVHISKNATFVVCRCDAGFARRLGVCTPCTFAQICPRFSDVALPNVCEKAAPYPRSISDISHLRDPVAEKPCAAPSSAVFAPALPFYFGAHSRVELPSASTVSRCPPGQRYDADAGRRGLVWTVATTFVANANFELRIPALERRRLLVAPGDISGDILDARVHARARGRVWVPDFAAVCAACPANVTCASVSGSVGEEQPCPGSARIAARTCHPPTEVQTTTAAPPEQTPCPPRAVRYRGTCVCADDDRWPVPRADLASGFACLRRRQGLLPGTAHIGSVSGGGAVRGPDMAARLDTHDNLLLVYRLVHSATPTVLALGEGEPWQLAGLTTTHAILYRDNVLADLGLVDLTDGGVEVLPVAMPTQQAAVAVNVTREANNSVPLRWRNATGDAVEAGLADDTTALGVLLLGTTSPPHGELTFSLAQYAAADIAHVPQQLCLVVHNATFCPDEATRTNTGTTRVDTRLQLPAESWRLERFDTYAVADRAVVVLLYEFSQNTVRAWVAHCFGPDRSATRTGTLLSEHAAMASTAPCPPGSWLRGNLCVDPDVCRVSSVTTSSPRRNAADLVVHAHGHRYALSRTGLAAAATRRMMFGERVRLGAAAKREIGWWYVQVVEHDNEPCALWYNGTCWPCAAHDRCDVLPAQPCEVRGGRGRCACIDGFKGNPDQSCRVCPAGHTFCRGGFARACPPHSRTLFDGSTVCRCDSGFYRAADDTCQRCPHHFYCEHEARHPCPDHRQTLQAGQSSVAACACPPGQTLIQGKDGCAVCPTNTFKPDAGDTECEACPSHRVAPNGSVACYCRPGFQPVPAAPATCAPCPAREYACPLGQPPRACRLRDYERVRNATDHACVCVDGWFRDSGGACQPCVPGMFCHDDQARACPRSMTSPGLAFSEEQCFCASANEVRRGSTCICAQDTFRQLGRCVRCPMHSTTDGVGAEQLHDCRCDAGYVWQPQAGVCAPCPRGHFCGRGSVQPTPCLPGTFGPGPGLRTQQQCLPCGAVSQDEYAGHPGQWHPALCYPEMRILHPRPALDAALNLSASAEAIVRLPANATQSLAAQHVAPHGSVQRFSSTQVRVHMHHFLPAAILLELAREEHATAWDELKTATENVHGMMFAVVVVGVFCSLVEHALRDVPGSVLEQCLAPVMFAKSSQVQDRAQEIVNMFRPHATLSIRVDPTSDASMIEDDLSRARRLNVALVVGTESLLLAPGTAGAWEAAGAALLPPLEVLQYRFTPGDCLQVLRAVLPECAAHTAVAVGMGDAAMCSVCAHHEFRNAQGECQPCRQCEAYEVVCCGLSDAQCAAASGGGGAGASAAALCLNGRHDYGEACDPTDVNLALVHCCTAQCTLLPGYHVGQDGCEARCGDQVVAAEVEECDDLADPMCDAVTCKKVGLR